MSANLDVAWDPVRAPRWGAAKRVVVLVLCLAAPLFLFRLGQRDLHSSHEARAAQNAQMVLDENAWGLPRLFDGRVEMQKPPLYYWCVAALGWFRGIDAWAVRLPAALSALLCVGFVTWRMSQRGRPVAGLCAGLILATMVHFTWLARVGRIDMPLTLAVTMALGCFHLGVEEGRRRWLVVAYGAVAVGILLKGPIALVLVGVVLMWEHAGRRELLRSLWWGLPLMFALAAPWFLWADHQTNHEFGKVFFWYHNVERGLGSEVLASHPFWFYVPVFFRDLAPWSILLPWALWYSRRQPDADARRGLVWLLAIFAFLSCMRFKRADYLLPAYPGLALFLGCTLERAWQHSTKRVWLVRGFAAVLMGYVAAWAWHIEHEPIPREPTYRELATEIRRRTTVPVIFFRFEAHALAYHVGRPLDTILEWENLEVWATQADPVYIVMSPESAATWSSHLRRGSLEEVLRTAGNPERSERALVVMRSIQ